MRKVGSKILSWFLTVVIVLGLMPMNTYAAETTGGHSNHKVCENAEEHECTHDIITEWQELDGSKNVLATGNYYLSKDVSFSNNIQLGEGANVVICLNGYKLSPQQYVMVRENTSLKICDCSAAKTGVLNGQIYGWSSTGFDAELYSGTIKRVNLEHPKVLTFNMYGGKIDAGSEIAIATAGGGTEVTANINIYGGEIKGKIGINIGKSKSSQVNISGGTIATQGTGTGYKGINIWGTGTLNISGGKIVSDDQAMYTDGTDFSVNLSGDAEISGTSYAMNLGNGYSNGAKLTITGSPKISSANGYALYGYKTIDIQDSPTIIGNVLLKTKNGTTAYPIFQLTGALTLTNPITLDLEYPNYVITKDWATYMPGKTSDDEVAKYFNTIETGFGIKYNETESEILAGEVINLTINDYYEKKKGTDKEVTVGGRLNISPAPEIMVYSDETYQTVSDVAAGRYSNGYYYVCGKDNSVLPAGTYYMLVKAIGYEDLRAKIVVKDPITPAIEFTNGNVINDTNNSTTGRLQTKSVYSPSAYTVKVYDSMDATEVSQKVSGSVSSNYLKLSALNGGYLEGGAYYVSITNTDSGNLESDRVLVYVKSTGANGTIINVPNNITFGDAPFEIQAVAPEGMEDAEWTWSSSDSSLVKVTPDENDSSKAIVTVLGATTGVTITATYTTDLYVGTATQTIVVVKGAPAESELPDVYSPGNGVLCLENTTNSRMYWGMKIVKVEGESEKVVLDWEKISIYGNDYQEVAPFEGGTYKVCFCYEEAMVKDPNTGRYTVPGGAVTTKTCTIETPVYFPDNDGSEDTYTLDYANSSYGEIYISPSADKAYAAMMKPYYGERLDAEDFNSFKAKYFTYDGINWYKLPEGQEIVIVNTSDEVKPNALGATNVPVYNFEATLKNLSIAYVNLGIGDLNFTIDGEVFMGRVSHSGNLAIVGKGRNDSYTAGNIEVRYGFDPSMTSNVTIQNLKTVTLGNENVEYAVYAINDITIKDCGVVSAEQGEEPYSDYYIYSVLYSSNGDITIDNVDELSVNSAYVGIYASNGVEYESLSLNEEVTKGNIAISNVGKMNITSEIIGVYAKGNITFEDVFGSITALDTEDGCAVLTYGGAISVTNEKRFAVESGATKDNADRLTLENNVVTARDIGSYFAIVDDVFVLSKFVAKVDAALKDYEIFPVNNITVKADMDEFIQKVLDELEEEGLSFEVRSFNLTSAKDSEPGNIVVEIYFKYVDPENPQAIQEETLNTTIVIPLRVYVEEKYKELGAAMADIPEIITSENKQSYSDALAIVNELLNDANKMCLEDDELDEVEWAYEVLVEKLELIAEIESALEKLNEDYNSIPADGELTSANIDAINDALKLAKILLGEVAPNLTDAQKAEVETIKAELEEKLVLIDKVNSDLDDLIDKVEDIPELEDITKAEKEDVLAVLDAIDAFESAYAENLTDEQKTVVAELKESVEERMDKIQAEIVVVIENVVKDTLASITEVTNDSDVKAKVKAAVDAVLAADPTLAGVTVTYDITKVNATISAAGNIAGKVVITSGDAAKEVAVSYVIEKLVHQHDFIWVIVKDATDTEVGKMEGTCACGETQTKEIPATAGDDASGKVTVESDEDNDFKAQLTDDEDVKGKIELTQDEQDAIIAGEDLEIILKLEDTTVEVDTAEKEDIAEKLAEKEFEGKKLGTFLDINLIKKIGNTETKITNTTGMLKLTFEVPASLINKDAAINRTYTIARNHDGKVEFLKAEFNKETNQLTFETDKFSTYAVIYEDTAVVPEAPKTADATNFMPILALLFAGLGMVVVGKKKRA